MPENKEHFENSMDKIILEDEEISKKIKEIVPQKLDESDAESRIKYIDKIESTINYIENKIKNNASIEEQKKQYFINTLENKKQNLNNSDFKQGTTNKKFQETFSDMCPKLLEKIKEERNKKDGVKDVSFAVIDKGLLMSALDKIMKTKNEEFRKRREEEKQKTEEEHDR